MYKLIIFLYRYAFVYVLYLHHSEYLYISGVYMLISITIYHLCVNVCICRVIAFRPTHMHIHLVVRSLLGLHWKSHRVCPVWRPLSFLISVCSVTGHSCNLSCESPFFFHPGSSCQTDASTFALQREEKYRDGKEVLLDQHFR